MKNKFWKKLACFFGGHPCVPTGRHGIVIREMKCERCGDLYVQHRDYGNMLIPANEGSDRIFSDVQRLSQMEKP